MRRPPVVLLLALLALGGCANSIRHGYAVEPSQALAQPTDTTLGRGVALEAAKHPGESGFVALPSGVDAFIARIAAIDAAESTLDLQYYIVHEGITTRAIIARLIRAADRGVRVRFLLDDTSSQGNDFSVRMLAAHPNIEVRLFNPLREGRGTGLGRLFGMIADADTLHRRMHNKALIADNAAAVVGGRNLGDEYFGANPKVNFADLDLLAVGPVVGEVSESFDRYWNSPYALPMEAIRGRAPSEAQLAHARDDLAEYLTKEKVARSDYLQRIESSNLRERIAAGTLALTWGRASAVYDDPSKVASDGVVDPDKRIGPRLLARIGEAKQELFIVSPYFIPQDEGTARLTALARKGVKVTVITNSLAANDVGIVHDAYAQYRKPLLEGGVAIHEVRAKPKLKGHDGDSALLARLGSSRASLHTKAFVIDRAIVFVGSMNLDPRSLLWNTELGFVVESPALAAQLMTVFEQVREPGLSFEVILETRGKPPQPKLTWVTEEAGERVLKRAEPASIWKRFSNWVLGFITPEDLL